MFTQETSSHVHLEQTCSDCCWIDATKPCRLRERRLRGMYGFLRRPEKQDRMKCADRLQCNAAAKIVIRLMVAVHKHH